MSMAQGFAQGFGMMNNFMQQQDAKEQQAAQAAENNRRYNEGVDWRNKTHDEQAQQLVRQNNIADENRTLTQAQLGLTPNMTMDEKSATLAEQKRIADSNANENRLLDNKAKTAQIASTYSGMKTQQLNQDILKNQLTDYHVQAGFNNLLSGGTVTPEQEQAFKQRLPDFIPAIAKRSDGIGLYANQFQELEQGFETSKTPEEKQYFQNELLKHATAATPEAKALFHTGFYQSYQDRMKDNPDIKEISHAGFADVNGKFVPLMDITYKDGRKVERVPATANKTDKHDDTIVSLTANQITQRAAQAVTLAGSTKKMLDENPALAEHYGVKQKPKNTIIPYGASVMDENGKIVAQNERTGPGSTQNHDNPTGNALLQAEMKIRSEAAKNMEDEAVTENKITELRRTWGGNRFANEQSGGRESQSNPTSGVSSKPDPLGLR